MKQILSLVLFAALATATAWAAELDAGFRQPPHAARPWVYWFWMDGNLSREGITADLEAMQRAGLGGLIIMEVDVGVPRGPVRFMSDRWRALFKHAVNEAERLGLEMTLNAGPGWTGSGGPWVKPEQSMQHLVASAVEIVGPTNFNAVLPRPARRPAYFGEDGLPPGFLKSLDQFYADVAVLAFPTPSEAARIPDIDEKALYLRHPYSSRPGTKPFLPAPANYPEPSSNAVIAAERILDLTGQVQPDGRLIWNAPPGRWTVLRFGRTSTGANTRPAPAPGLGLECDKFDPAALDAHFEAFIGTLVRELGPRPVSRAAGWTMLHIDSWEMGAQNWTARFREEFQSRRGYDPLRYLPVASGRTVESREISERFLWDWRQTAQELVLANHAQHLKELGRRHGFGLSIEPYDMNPCADLSLGGVADVPMCEFWSQGYGFQTAFSCLEAVSVAHTLGRPIVAAEAFTADDREAWRLHPARMKAQADWAFCLGINRLVFHRYAHQPWLDRWPGMTMGPYGVHYERTQTWWEMVGPWHEYLARCQFMLRRGLPVADVCYLAPEGAPHVFRPPPSALQGSAPMPDRRGYNFDGCAPETLLARMTVKGGQLMLPDGMSYRLLVLPEMETMTPTLLRKVKELAESGATVLGSRPVKSPSLSGYPQCDAEVQRFAAELWGPDGGAEPLAIRTVGRGRLIDRGRPAPSPGATFDPSPSLAEAKWIWHREGNPASAVPVGTRQFRRTLKVGDEGPIEFARLVMTADNSFQAQVNGKFCGEGDDFKQHYTFDLKPLLQAGSNVLTVSAKNGGETPNPAGLIGVAEIRFQNGRTLRVPTDRQWESAESETKPWQTALELGRWDIAPWGKTDPSAAPRSPELYGDYEQVAALLARAGVPPDFESDAPLRYTHRRDGETEIYFVANREQARVEAVCTFRVAGKAPTLWDPVSGRIFAHPSSADSNGRTRLTLTLEGHGSRFVVFQRAPVPATIQDEALSPRLQTLLEISGPWEVRFQPQRGAPERITLDRLIDWSTHSDPGVKHFSGVATYTGGFRISDLKSPIFLDLGQVQVMARVKVNATDLGVLWKSPFRVDITRAVKSGDNVLEVSVANLWLNRLIGDQALPAGQRVTWSTWNPFKKETPLLESGWLGPATLARTEAGRPLSRP